MCSSPQEENDANYEEELEVADVFDSDFDEDVCITPLSAFNLIHIYSILLLLLFFLRKLIMQKLS